MPEVKMSRGSSVCEIVCKKIVEYFKNNVLQHQITVSSGLKRRETFQRVISVQFKASTSDGMGVHKCIWYGQLACFGRLYECWKAYKGFRATYAPLQRTCISAGESKTTYCSYYNSMASWLKSPCAELAACSPDLSPIENIWCIIQLKICQRWPRTLHQLETYIKQEWDQIPTSKLQKLITSMPRRLQTVLKRRGDATPW